MSNLKTSIYAMIEEVAAAEKITRKTLAALSRDMLLYVPDSQDIEAVNRLLGVLTPMNRRVAILYFDSFLPWEQEKDADGNFTRFGKKTKGDKKLAAAAKKIVDWLADESNNIWTWSDQNIELKQKDFVGLLTRAIQKALDGDEKTDTPALTQAQVVATIISAGVDIDTMLEGVETKMQENDDALKLLADPNTPAPVEDDPSAADVDEFRPAHAA